MLTIHRLRSVSIVFCHEDKHGRYCKLLSVRTLYSPSPAFHLAHLSRHFAFDTVCSFNVLPHSVILSILTALLSTTVSESNTQEQQRQTNQQLTVCTTYYISSIHHPALRRVPYLLPVVPSTRIQMLLVSRVVIKSDAASTGHTYVLSCLGVTQLC